MRMKKNLFLLCAFLVPALISAQISSKDAWKQASKLEKSIEKNFFPEKNVQHYRFRCETRYAGGSLP